MISLNLFFDWVLLCMGSYFIVFFFYGDFYIRIKGGLYIVCYILINKLMIWR